MKVNYYKSRDAYYKTERRSTIALQNKFYDLMSLMEQHDIKCDERNLQKKGRIKYTSECLVVDLKKYLNDFSDINEECIAVKVITGMLAGTTLKMTKNQNELHIRLYISEESSSVIKELEIDALTAILAKNSAVHIRLEILNEE